MFPEIDYVSRGKAEKTSSIITHLFTEVPVNKCVIITSSIKVKKITAVNKTKTAFNVYIFET